MIKPLAGNFIFAGSVTVLPLLSYICNLKALGYANYSSIIYGQIIFEIFMVLLVRSTDFRVIRIVTRSGKTVNIQHLIGFRLISVTILSCVIGTLIYLKNFNLVVWFYLIAGILTFLNFEAIYQAMGEQISLAKIKLLQLSLFFILSLINLYIGSLIFVGVAFLLTNMIYVLCMLTYLHKGHLYNVSKILKPKLARKLYYRYVAMILLNKLIWLSNARITHVVLVIFASPALMVLYDFYYKCFGMLSTLVNVLNNTFLKEVLRKNIRKDLLLYYAMIAVLISAALIQFLVSNIVINFIDIPRNSLIPNLNYIILLNMCILSASSLIGVIFLVGGTGSRQFYNSTYLMILVQVVTFCFLYLFDKLTGAYLLVPITTSLICELLYRMHHARRIFFNK
jgi:hypothetical protein